MYKKLALASLALLVSGVAVAGDQNLYKHLDADQNGVISADEAAVSPELTSQWTRLDANADGMVDRAEFAKMEVREMNQNQPQDVMQMPPK
ncbi:MAG: EF-hand domain-containing protein [Gammaproteobacteria bacterium]|nr:EF-hand domain-containing protein [Gammaproteobacteria bacterium]